jgi:hypothetical protein
VCSGPVVQKVQQFDRLVGYGLSSGTSPMFVRNATDAAREFVFDAAYLQSLLETEYQVVDYFLAGILKERALSDTECMIVETRLPYQELIHTTCLKIAEIDTKLDDAQQRLNDEKDDMSIAWLTIRVERFQLRDQKNQIMLDYVEKMRKCAHAHTEAFKRDAEAVGLTEAEREEFVRAGSIAARGRR